MQVFGLMQGDRCLVKMHWRGRFSHVRWYIVYAGSTQQAIRVCKGVWGDEQAGIERHQTEALDVSDTPSRVSQHRSWFECLGGRPLG